MNGAVLKNELKSLDLLIRGFVEMCIGNSADQKQVNFSASLDKACKHLENAFVAATFSEYPDHTLNRYFYYHLKGIGQIADTLFTSLSTHSSFDPSVLEPLVKVIDLMLNSYSNIQCLELPAPISWQAACKQRLKEVLSTLKIEILTSELPQPFKILLQNYLDDWPSNEQIGYSYRSIRYKTNFVQALSRHDWSVKNSADTLEELLAFLNFNHLPYIIYCQDRIGAMLTTSQDLDVQRAFLSAEKEKVRFLPDSNVQCHDNWPRLKDMLTGWLDEKISCCEKRCEEQNGGGEAPHTDKLLLNLPVAYIACLIRFFLEEDLLKRNSLTEIFKFVSKNFSSKRQPAISPGSLSKEYYGIDQSTAARVQDLLNRISNQINRQFFPLLAAAGVLIFY